MEKGNQVPTELGFI